MKPLPSDLLKKLRQAQNLYVLTGDIRDINTMLVNRADLAALLEVNSDLATPTPSDMAEPFEP
jgi:hypothetical protein